MGRRWTCSCPWASPAPARKSPASAPRPSTSLRLAVLALPETCLGKRDGRTGDGSAGLGACLGMLDVRGIGFESLVSRVALGDSRALPQRSLILSPGEAGPLKDLGPLSIQSAEQSWKRGSGVGLLVAGERQGAAGQGGRRPRCSGFQLRMSLLSSGSLRSGRSGSVGVAACSLIERMGWEGEVIPPGDQGSRQW